MKIVGTTSDTQINSMNNCNHMTSSQHERILGTVAVLQTCVVILTYCVRRESPQAGFHGPEDVLVESQVVSKLSISILLRKGDLQNQNSKTKLLITDLVTA